MKVNEILKLAGLFIGEEDVQNSKILNGKIQLPPILITPEEKDDEKVGEDDTTQTDANTQNLSTQSTAQTNRISTQADTGTDESTDTGSSSDDSDTTESDSEETISKISKLLQCLNLVYQDLTRDYLPLETVEEITFLNGKFEYKNLSLVVRDIIKIEDRYGTVCNFKCFPTFVQADVVDAKITYTYEPENLPMFGEIEAFAGKLSERILAYGVAMEYFFLSSLSDEAAVWENRYVSSLENALRKKSNVIMPKRRWI